MFKYKSWCTLSTSVILLTLCGFCTYIILYVITSSSQTVTLFPNRTIYFDKISFTEQIKKIPWEEYSTSYVSNETEKLRYYSEILLLKLIPFLTKSPVAPINSTCPPPPLSIPNGLKCRTLELPRKIGVFLQLGFDIDNLEIHLNELGAIVDKFFILESIRSHSSYVKRKPLLWDMVKNQERFVPFRDKIVHFVVDDSYLPQAKSDEDAWQLEMLQEKLRWHKFLQWNDKTAFFQNSDILGFGDTDEVPYRNNIYFLKTCKFDFTSLDIGIWFPFNGINGINDIFQTDFPVRDHPYTLGDPTYWTLKHATQVYNDSGQRSYPTRLRGKSPAYLLGGMHLSRYSYPPLRFAKLLTASEADMTFIQLVIEAGEHYANNKLEEADSKLNYVFPGFKSRIVNLKYFRKINKQEANAVIKLPWFYNCNKERYPAFEGRHDLRLDA